MNLLIDTHTLIWYLNGDKELSSKAKASIEAPDATNLVSVASLWEIAIKVSLKKLDLKKPFKELILQIDKNGFEMLPINSEHTLLVSELEFKHRDPFDRILIAQSIVNNLKIVTKDEDIKKYNVSVVW